MELYKSVHIITRIIQPLEKLDVDKFMIQSSSILKNVDEEFGNSLLLKKQKSKIDHIYKNVWLNISFLSNPYEYIHPKITKYYKNDKIVSMNKPISRAFYKMWEIMNIFPIFNYKYNNNNLLYHKDVNYIPSIKTAHLCEGPGGFIEAVLKKRAELKNNLNHTTDEIHGLTLMSENKNKLFSHIMDKINIHYGDINDINTIHSFYQIFKFKKAHLITADGGFEDENREDIQEQLHYQLIFSEIITALAIQEINGRFICKIFDINTKLTAFYIKLLSYFYKEVYIYKPTSSRPINSERYLICIDFIGVSLPILNKLFEIKKIWSKIDSSGGMSDKIDQYVYSIYNDSSYTYNDISTFNNLYLIQQIKYINFALGSISNMDEYFFLNKIKQTQLNYSLEWCHENNIPTYNKYNIDDSNYILNMVNYIKSKDIVNIKKKIHSKGKLQLFIYCYITKSYDIIHLFINDIKLHNLIYYLTSYQIIDLFNNLNIEHKKSIIYPLSNYSYLFMNKPENIELKEYMMTHFKKEIFKYIIKTPNERLKYIIKTENFDILKQLFEDEPTLLDEMIKLAVNYNLSLSFIERLYNLNDKYVFTEELAIKTIKFGNFEIFRFIISKTNSIQITNNYIFNYVIKYEYPIDIILSMLKMFTHTPFYNIYELLKRDAKDIELIMTEFNIQHFNHPTGIKIFNLINENYKISIPVLLIIYKTEFLKWNIQEYNYLKNKLSLEQLEELIELINFHLYDNKI